MSILKFLFPKTIQNPKTSVAFLSSWQERGTGNVKDLNSFIVDYFGLWRYQGYSKGISDNKLPWVTRTCTQPSLLRTTITLKNSSYLEYTPLTSLSLFRSPLAVIGVALVIHVSVKLKRAPYRLIQKFTIIDNSGLWAVGVLLDF